MIHQDLLDEAMEVAIRVSGVLKLDDKDAMRRYPQLAASVIVAYSNMRAARIMTGEEPVIVVVPDPEPEEALEPPPLLLPPSEPEEIMVGVDGESVTINDGSIEVTPHD